MGLNNWIKKKVAISVKAEVRRRLFKEDAKKAIEAVGAPYAAKRDISTKIDILRDLKKQPSASVQPSGSAPAAVTKEDILREYDELPYLMANAAGVRREFSEKWGKSPLRVVAEGLGSSVVEGVKRTAHHWNPATLDFGYKPKKGWTKMEKFDLVAPTAIAEFLLPRSVKSVTKQNVGRAAAAAAWGVGGFAIGDVGHAAVTSVADGIRSDDAVNLEKNNRAFEDEKTVRPELLSDVGLLKHYISTKLIPEYRGLAASTNREDRVYAAELTRRRLEQMEGTDAFNALIEERRAAQLRGDAQDDERLKAFDNMTTLQKLGGE